MLNKELYLNFASQVILYNLIHPMDYHDEFEKRFMVENYDCNICDIILRLYIVTYDRIYDRFDTSRWVHLYSV